MSANRLRSGNDVGIDCPDEIDFSDLIAASRANAIWRVQGKVEDATKASGRLVRFNRSVRILPETATITNRGPTVIAERIRWNWRAGRFDTMLDANKTPIRVTLEWAQLDWATRVATGDPNGAWTKIVGK